MQVDTHYRIRRIHESFFGSGGQAISVLAPPFDGSYMITDHFSLYPNLRAGENGSTASTLLLKPVVRGSRLSAVSGRASCRAGSCVAWAALWLGCGRTVLLCCGAAPTGRGGPVTAAWHLLGSSSAINWSLSYPIG